MSDTVQVARVPDPLAPVRDALLAGAQAERERMLAAADAEAAAILAKAQGEADAVLAEARAQGETDAAGVLAAERARARRQARGVVLVAERAAYDRLRSQVVDALPSLRADPGYGPWRDALAAHARAALGPDAVVSEHPDGGVLAVAGGRRAAYTLEGLAEQVIDALGPDVEGLWSS